MNDWQRMRNAIDREILDSLSYPAKDIPGWWNKKESRYGAMKAMIGMARDHAYGGGQEGEWRKLQRILAPVLETLKEMESDNG